MEITEEQLKKIISARTILDMENENIDRHIQKIDSNQNNISSLQLRMTLGSLKVASQNLRRVILELEGLNPD